MMTVQSNDAASGTVDSTQRQRDCFQGLHKLMDHSHEYDKALVEALFRNTVNNMHEPEPSLADLFPDETSKYPWAYSLRYYLQLSGQLSGLLSGRLRQHKHQVLVRGLSEELVSNVLFNAEYLQPAAQEVSAQLCFRPVPTAAFLSTWYYL